MPVCPRDLELRLYEDALLELGRAARTFAAAISRAAEMGKRIEGDVGTELAARVLDECRAALLPALIRAPGMLQMFASS